ncbi:hypothetical protein C8J56DRAFT_1026442 [Mycena floridula]|nr:hypothetical protein C8J56DRAFT_1026442 [Mycena floridula]
MPSFSLVRCFGKQRKATIDSPVSSGLVEQHIGHTMAGSNSESWTRQQFQAGNVFSIGRANDSHDLSNGPVALSQRVEGLALSELAEIEGNINAPVMSNNNVNINNYYQSQAKDSDASLFLFFKSFAVLRVGDIHLEEEIGSYLDENNVWRTRYKGQIMASSTSNMSIWSYHGERAEELYGTCHSPNLTALVFHGTPWLLDQWEYYKLLPVSQWIPHHIKLHEQYESAHSMLEAHNLRGWPLHMSDVDETGKLVVAHFIPGPTVHSAFDAQIWMAFETSTFIKEDLLGYYKFFFDMTDWSTYLPTSTLLSPFDKAAPFQLSHPEINLPVYSLPDWNKVVNRIDKTVQDTGIVLTLLPNMTIRQTTSSKIFLSTPWIYKPCIQDWKKDTESPRLNNLLETKHLYLFCPQNSAGNLYWSQDEEGQHIIEDSLIQASFGITVDWYWDIEVYHVPPQLYEILHTIHEGCGFDPYSTQVAEYLGLPLVVTDGAHSRLEECMQDPEGSELGDSNYVLRDFNSDVEDPEYDSESESGDSDYVSASEDA